MGKIRETLQAVLDATGVGAMEARYLEHGACSLAVHDGEWKLSADVDSFCSPDESEGSLSLKAKLTLRFYASNPWKDGPRVRDVIAHLREVLAVFKAGPQGAASKPLLVSDGKRVKTEREVRLEALLARAMEVSKLAPEGSLLRAEFAALARELDAST